MSPASGTSNATTLTGNTEPFRPSTVIDLSIVAANYRAIRSHCPASVTAAVVKADAYGHGMAEVAATLSEEGAKDFFVAYPHEGEALRRVVPSDANIWVFNGLCGTLPGYFEAHALRPVLNTLVDINHWTEYSPKAPYALHLDTGMSRLGLPTHQIDAAQKRLTHPPSLLMSHLAQADDPEASANVDQLDAFTAAATHFPDSPLSISATGGLWLGADFHLDMVRPGIGLYGGGPTPPTTCDLTPVLTLTAPVLSVETHPKGGRVGYGGTHLLEAETTIATLGIGYADGYLRTFSNTGIVWLGGHECPVIGRVSMDLITVDATRAKTVRIGDRATLLGPEIDLEAQAMRAGTIGYELTSALGGRICRNWTR